MKYHVTYQTKTLLPNKLNNKVFKDVAEFNDTKQQTVMEHKKTTKT